MDSMGIVDRDRRSEEEVAYLRKKNILVPEVAEIENILMLEGVVRAVAKYRRRNDADVFNKVKRTVLNMFEHEIRAQALQHVRHRVKHQVEVRIDMKFRNINALEEHMIDLVNEIDPRSMYEDFCRDFHVLRQNNDYAGVLRVFNQKQILGESNVASLCGLNKKDDYIKAVLNILKTNSRYAQEIRTTIKQCFGLAE